MSKRATAAERTVSMFTGKTDTDLPDGSSRDGSREDAHEEARRVRLLKWRGGVTRWWTDSRKKDHEYDYEVELSGGVYIARFRGKELGKFPTITQAGQACNDHSTGRTK